MDGSTTTAYIYDAGGRRISENLNGTLTNYRWDEFSSYGDIVVETDSTNTVTASYVLGNANLSPKHVPAPPVTTCLTPRAAPAP